MKENILRLVSPIPVSVNHYMGIRAFIKYDKYAQPKAVAMLYETADAKKYKKKFSKYVIDEVKKQGWILPLDKFQHFYFDCIFYFGRIDQDANNYFKIMLDAVTDTQKIWVDDNVVCERVNRVYYDSENPRIEITIRPVEYIGIFDSVEQLQKFESSCISCSRYGRNCSILKKAKEGRVQEEISDLKCSKYKEKKVKK
jgi:Holliday junction resolvase RusA-like endonuclease